MARKVKISQEQQEEQSQAFVLKSLREQHINEPTVFWKVGERVQRGAIAESIVTEILDGGKILKLHEVMIGSVGSKNAGERTERDDYVAWHDVHKFWTKADYDDMPTFTEDEDLRISYSQRSLDGVFTTYYHFGLDMEPDYQRGNVWTPDDKVKLIDSIFRNIDIGKFVFIHLPFVDIKTPTYEMLDGKQRTTALIEFLERKFTFHGLTYDQLHWKDRNHFDNYPISWGEIHSDRADEKITAEQKYRYFLRLNTGGKLQDPEHIKRVTVLWEAVKGKK